jgi:hypothetical protein
MGGELFEKAARHRTSMRFRLKLNFNPKRAKKVRHMTMTLHAADISTRANPQKGAAPVGHVHKASTVRKCKINSLRSDGTVRVSEQIIPATSRFESAFSGFARGTLLDTDQGPVAVEDLHPGMRLMTAEFGASPLLWVGSITLLPKIHGQAQVDDCLTRVMADTYGMSRPDCDFVAGPGGRILARSPNLDDAHKAARVLIPVRELVNGMNVIEITPPRPVQVYHVCLQNHATLTAAGLEVESYHPGYGFEHAMGVNLLAFFLSLFPHIDTPEDFGRLSHPRLPL